MARYIDADEVLRRVKPYDSSDEKWAVTGGTAIRLIHNAIANTPTADVVPVVRCNDCIFFDDTPNDTTSYCMRPIKSGDYEETGYSFPLEVPTAPYEFCSYGERMIYDGEIHRR